MYYIPWTVYTFLATLMKSIPAVAVRHLCRRDDLLRQDSAFDYRVCDGAILSYWLPVKAHVQPESAVNAIAVVFCGGVALLALMAIVFSKQMSWIAKRTKWCCRKSRVLKQAASLRYHPSPCGGGRLVGHRYEECWGNSPLFKTTTPLLLWWFPPGAKAPDVHASYPWDGGCG